MVNPINKSAFTLVEVLTATIVMTMMMVAVIAYIQYGALVWQKGHSKVSADNYTRLSFDLIKEDLMKAKQIDLPAASTGVSINNQLCYYISDTGEQMRIAVTNKVLNRKIDSADADKIRTWNTRIARNVASFTVARLSTWTYSISLQIRSDSEAVEDMDFDGDIDFDDREIVSSESLTLTAPGAGG